MQKLSLSPLSLSLPHLPLNPNPLIFPNTPPPSAPPPPSPLPPPTTDWTMSLTDYMNVCVTRLCNESPLLKSGGRHESHSSTRHQSSSAAHQNQGPSEEDEAELNKWQYITHLASYLYHVCMHACTCVYTCIYMCVSQYVECLEDMLQNLYSLTSGTVLNIVCVCVCVCVLRRIFLIVMSFSSGLWRRSLSK